MTSLLHAFPAQLDTIDGPVHASVILSWDPTEAAALRFDMATIGGRQRWDISRDLVLDALRGEGEHGEGDVITEARGADFLLFLYGTIEDEWVGCQIRMPRASVAWLAEQSCQIIPPGSEAEINSIMTRIDSDLAELGGAA